MNRGGKIAISSANDFIIEARRLPNLNRRLFNDMNGIEQALFNVGEKHGVFDEITSHDFDPDNYEGDFYE